jgi:cytochrome c-type biogenesis protein
MQAPASTEEVCADKPSISERIQSKFGVDFSVFKEAVTWKGFFIGIVMFSIIGYSGLSIFGLASDSYGVDRSSARLAPDFEMETLNRSAIEHNLTNDTGWFRLSDHLGKVVILDFMAIDCANCHLVQEHFNLRKSQWERLNGEHEVILVSIGSWYSYESLVDLNETFGDSESDRLMTWLVGTGTPQSIIANQSTGERGDMVEHYSAQSLPVVFVIDHEGYVVAKEATGTPLDGWNSFDSTVEKANAGLAEDLRFSLKKIDRSASGIFLMGLLLGVLVYFSPCAFPILPGYISYYIGLSQREDELLESGKLSSKMPHHSLLGGLAALGQLTFFGIIAIIVIGLGQFVNLSGTLHYFALFVAVLLFVLGAFMLTGGTAHLLGFVQRLVDRWSTTEMDDKFTPKRNMYLWGIGYSAASIDCTAAAVIPFIGYLAIVGGTATWTGLAGIMLSISVLMIAVTTIVGMGQQRFINILRRSTNLIKVTGSWMMMFAGIGLIIYLTQPKFIASLVA